MSGMTKEQMDQYIKDTQADAATMRDQVFQTGERLRAEVYNLAGMYEGRNAAYSDMALNRITEAENILRAAESQKGAELTRSINQAVDLFTAASESLGGEARQNALSELNKYKTDIQNLEAQALGRADEAFTKADKDTADLVSGLRGDTASLGDTFLQRAGEAQANYLKTMEEAISTSPERLAEFSRAADQLSQAAVQTRMNMLATADPRALELSAIADENAAAMMSGRIGADMQANLARSSAMRALQGGFGASSEMGRGLAARDLGLTAMDLQQRGVQDFERQRALNFNTRVAGLQVDATGLRRDAQNLLSRQGETLLNAQTQTAESDRNQRFAALGTGFEAQANNVAGRRDQTIGLARDIFGTRVNASTEGLRQNLSNLDNIYTNRLNTAGTVFNARSALGEQLFKTGMGVASDIYGTRVNTAGDMYRTSMNMMGNIFDRTAATETTVAGANTQASRDTLDSMVRARGSAAGTMANAYQQDMLNSQQQQANNTALWGSAINTGASLAGNVFGSMNFGGGFGSKSAMQSRTQPGTTGSWNFGMGWVPKATAVT